jgi:hypothetical protein
VDVIAQSGPQAGGQEIRHFGDIGILRVSDKTEAPELIANPSRDADDESSRHGC